MTDFDLTFNKNDVETVRDLLIGRIKRIKEPEILFAIFIVLSMSGEELEAVAKAFKSGKDNDA